MHDWRQPRWSDQQQKINTKNSNKYFLLECPTLSQKRNPVVFHFTTGLKIVVLT